ncbi:hypothetical protein JOC27_000200 [Sporolactobacillus spathodeae]|uniref:Uncharacterized protein n=1 Tax=Sporolactobacillus spathodeae TaxID=1465502 RepID=A0ABS2Q4Q0_9BACL|nr:hypothetical protein [Sporolactobacillus spathodeae]
MFHVFYAARSARLTISRWFPNDLETVRFTHLCAMIATNALVNELELGGQQESSPCISHLLGKRLTAIEPILTSFIFWTKRNKADAPSIIDGTPALFSTRFT